MPMYEYRCRSCANTFEALVRGENLPPCPQCGSVQLERLVSAPVAPGHSKAIIASARKQAAREGHFSNFSQGERNRLLK